MYKLQGTLPTADDEVDDEDEGGSCRAPKKDADDVDDKDGDKNAGVGR